MHPFTFFYLIVGTLAAAVSAAGQSISSRNVQQTYAWLEASLPQCEASCFSAALSNVTCSTDDMSCLCDNQLALVSFIRGCDLTNCTANQDLKAVNTIKTACGIPAHDEANNLRTIYWTLYGVALICFASRVVARSSYFGGMFWWDDWFIVASFAVLTGVSVGAELMVVFGLGKDIWDLDSTKITVVLVLFYVAEFAYVIESALTKTSIVCLYLRIFPAKEFRRACFGMLAFIVCFAIVFLVTLLTYCVPFSYVWLAWDGRHSGKCINMTAQTYVCAALNIVMDVSIFLMPIPKLLKLETNWKTKVGVIFTFMLGLFVTICSVVRLKFLFGWASSTNQSYDYANLALWSLIELNAGVICACLPGMASLFRKIKKSHQDKKRTGTGYGTYGNNSSARSPGGTRQFGTKSNQSALRSFSGNNDIMKTTTVSVQYKPRADDELSDEVELMDQRFPDSFRMNRNFHQ